MCGRFGLTRPDRLKLERFGLGGAQNLAPRFNIAPGTDVFAVRERQGVREACVLHWGLVPWWADDPGIGARMANARSDTAFVKPAFRDAMRHRRCLIPADVFYEWQQLAGRRQKQPYAVALASGEPFALGGIWDSWKPRGESSREPLDSCSILTTEPNTLLALIHDRMPVIVPERGYSTWLDPHAPVPALQELLVPFPSNEMRAWPISTRVNDAACDAASILEPVEPPAAPAVLDLFG
jgi:putative SOS response-associated peptidase YedK